MALNDEATISVVDPLFGFGGTKLLALIPLSAPGIDWVLTEDQSRLFVSLANAVAVIDTHTWKVIEEIAMPMDPWSYSVAK